MRRFHGLYRALDATSRTSRKEASLVAYFETAPAADAAWAAHLLLGRRGRRTVSTRHLREWAAEESRLPLWLVEESYDAVGDLAETLALLVGGSLESGSLESGSLESGSLESGRVESGSEQSGSEQSGSEQSGSEQSGGEQSGREDFGREDRGGAPGGGEGGRAASEPEALGEFIERRVLGLAGLEPEDQRELVLETWGALDAGERFLFHKLISGGFRVGVAGGLVARALAKVAGVDRATMMHRLAGRWEPTAEAWEALMSEDEGGDPLRPYPFFLAHAVPAEVEDLGAAADFQAEWKWDGIRAQAVRRGVETVLWSRGGDLVNGGFPEIIEELRELEAGTVIDGELLAWDGERPMGFHQLQRRIQRKTVGKKLREEVPVRLMAYDLLEEAGEDLRALPTMERRRRLEALVQRASLSRLAAADVVEGSSWETLAGARASARERGVEGLMLKRLDAPYRAGRPRGDWWKWKVDPFTLDVVLVYAQRGHGRRASLYTDYTLAVWSGDELVPVAKAYSGLTDKEIRRVDAFVRRHIVDRFGPVRVVEPELVFEIAFEGIQPSTRHKAGLSLRFPRIARWREDKTPADADTLASVRALMGAST